MKPKKASKEYVERARALSKEDAERLFARMRKKLARRVGDEEVEPLEAVALQLQIEDEELKEWRDKMDEIRKKN